jgi:hypothetical protein
MPGGSPWISRLQTPELSHIIVELSIEAAIKSMPLQPLGQLQVAAEQVVSLLPEGISQL